MLYPEPDGSPVSRLFGSFLVLAGLFLVGVFLRDAYRDQQARAWPAVPCTILASSVEEQPGESPYRFHILYRYAWRGRRFVGHSHRRVSHRSSDIAVVERLVRAYPQDAVRACFVNPANPTEAVLEREALWEPVAGVLGFTAAVAIVGRLFVFPRRQSGRRALLGDLPVGRPTAFLLCLFVLVLGSVGFAWITAIPIMKTVSAARWKPTPCTVVASRIRTKVHGGEHPVWTWWPDVVFRYRVNGRDYRANTVNLTDLPTVWYYGERGIAARYVPGAATTCYVNPDDPSEAVLTRHLSVDLWLGVWPLLMVIFGAVGMVGVALDRDKFGSPAAWGKLAVWSALWFSLIVFQAMGSDLIRDWRAGTADVLEALLVSLAGLVVFVVVASLWGLSLRRGRAGLSPAGIASRGA